MGIIVLLSKIDWISCEWRGLPNQIGRGHEAQQFVCYFVGLTWLVSSGENILLERSVGLHSVDDLLLEKICWCTASFPTQLGAREGWTILTTIILLLIQRTCVLRLAKLLPPFLSLSFPVLGCFCLLCLWHCNSRPNIMFIFPRRLVM
jgi:hypothetical protein